MNATTLRTDAPNLDRTAESLPRHRRTFGPTLVAALYVLMLACSPLIVRYAPDPGRLLVVATSAKETLDVHRCAKASKNIPACDTAPRVN